MLRLNEAFLFNAVFVASKCVGFSIISFLSTLSLIKVFPNIKNCLFFWLHRATTARVVFIKGIYLHLHLQKSFLYAFHYASQWHDQVNVFFTVYILFATKFQWIYILKYWKALRGKVANKHSLSAIHLRRMLCVYLLTYAHSNTFAYTCSRWVFKWIAICSMSTVNFFPPGGMRLRKSHQFNQLPFAILQWNECKKCFTSGISLDFQMRKSLLLTAKNL